MNPTLDALRARYPHLGFALYAYKPGGPVTLECMTAEGRTFSFRGTTEAEAILAGFAEDFAPPPATPPPAPADVFA